MNVTIIGAGNMGRGIGTRLLAGGHHVTLIDRGHAKAQELANSLNHSSTGGASATTGQMDRIQDDVIVLAVGYGTNLDLARQLGSALTGKIVVDITNPVDFATFTLATAPGSSSAEEVAAAAPSARVVKAFNTTFAGTLVAGQVAGQPLDVFIAGDDPAAKQTLAELVRDGGLIPVDVGPLARAQQLEGLGYLGISIQQPLGLNFASAWKLLH
jgi:8-hydroxy-5-deazaflavin:NADPH oxidoreductase